MSSRKTKEDTWTEAELLKIVKPKDETKKHPSSERHRRKEHGDREKQRKRDRTETYDVDKSEKKEGERSEKSSTKSQKSIGSHNRKTEGRPRDESKDKSLKESTRKSAGDSQKSQSRRDGKEKHTRERESKKENVDKGRKKEYDDETKRQYGKEKNSKEVKYKLSEDCPIELDYGGNANPRKDIEQNKSSQQSCHITAMAAETEYNYDDDEFDDYDDDFEDDDDDDVDDASESKDNNDDEIGYRGKHDQNLSDIEDNALVNKKSSQLLTIENSGDSYNAGVSNFKKRKERLSVDLNKSRDMPGDGQNIKDEAYGELNMNDVVMAIYEENEKAYFSGSQNSRPSTGTERVEPEPLPYKVGKKIGECYSSVPTQSAQMLTGKINFVAASRKQQNEKVSLKTKRRGEELLKLVQLDIRSIDLFDMAPMSEYELYMKRFGQSGCTQVCTQTRDDDGVQNTQTEEVEISSKWCQCSHELKSCGNDVELNSVENMNAAVLNMNTSRLNGFLLKAGQMMLSLFSELDAGIEQHQMQYTELKTKLSDGFVTLASNPLLSSASFVDVLYSSSHTSMVLAAYSKTHGNEADSSRGVVSVWNTNDPTGPSAYLICESPPTCCCFSSSSPLLVFAGMEDGVLCLWDLREPSALHESKDGKVVQRTATYTTSASNDNHYFPVVAVSPLLANSWATDGGGSGEVDMSFQLLSLDEGGTFNVWIIIEVHPDVSDTSNVKEDLGLSPRGSVKLVKSSYFHVFPPSLISNLICSAVCVQVDTVQPNHLYVGMDNGCVQHVLRFGSRPVPQVFRTTDNVGNKVNSIDVSPWKLPYFLAGCDDGSVYLFHNKRTMPICKWTIYSQNSIIKVKWSLSRAQIFFALDSEGSLYVWDMFQSNFEPVYKEQITRKSKKVIDFALANNYACMTANTVVRDAEMALVYDDSSIEIHRLTNGMSIMDGDELGRLDEYLGNII